MKEIGNSILEIYYSFKYDLFDEMERHKLEKCCFRDYYEYYTYGEFYFLANNGCNIKIAVDKDSYKYYHELVSVFKYHKDWLFEIGEYDYDTNTFYIVFKKPIYKGYEKEAYRISTYGIIADDYFIDTDVVYKTLRHTINSVYGLEKEQFGLPVCKELPPFKFNFSGYRIPILSKPPIFNPPATICYWTDGTKTVVKCQEGDSYSPEAGLALCYMKKVLGNTSKDLNKELHKYIPEESEDNNE